MWPPLLLLVVIVVGWELVVTSQHISSTVLPSPVQIVRSGWSDRSNLWSATWITLREAIFGIALATAFSLAVGIAIDFFITVRRSVYPLLVASQTLPIVAIAPLVIIWFGFGFTPKVVLVALYTFFPIVVGLVQGLASTHEDSMNLMRTMGAGRFQILLKARLPSAMPQFFTGLRIAVTYAIVAGIIAEFVGAADGLGVYINSAKDSFRTDLVFAAVVVTVIITLVMLGLVVVAERVVMPWYQPAREDKRW
jgi:ABC-type nitrate/sulfonate/bicarbonate transport system permease component